MEQTTQLIYNDLQSRYKRATINKREIANELGVSPSTVDLYISKGYGLPNYKKLGTAKNATIRFSVVDVANFLSQTTKVA